MVVMMVSATTPRLVCQKHIIAAFIFFLNFLLPTAFLAKISRMPSFGKIETIQNDFNIRTSKTMHFSVESFTPGTLCISKTQAGGCTFFRSESFGKFIYGKIRLKSLGSCGSGSSKGWVIFLWFENCTRYHSVSDSYSVWWMTAQSADCWRFWGFSGIDFMG